MGPAGSIFAWVLLLAALSWGWASLSLARPPGGAPGDPGKPARNPRLLRLEPNVWVKIHQPRTATWRRQAHAGIAYDTRRGTLLLFGSDTHGSNWDNAVHEFDPVLERWITHYPPAPWETYRADKAGRAIAGTARLLPWAMHTFDNVLYDPKWDALVVTALPAHNPVRQRIPEARIHPTWVYHLETRTWRIFENNGRVSPVFFAAASAYDAHRDVIVAYGKNGVWEIGPERDQWKQATPERHHEIHFTMAYDTKHRKLAVFGDYHRTNAVWVYTPGPVAGTRGTWEKKVPGGDACPKDQHFPVAYDQHNGVFLLVPDEPQGPGGPRSITLVYDLAANRYTRLPRANLPPLGMNYMMVYDTRHRVFLLVTGDWREPATVWALKLDLGALERSQ